MKKVLLQSLAILALTPALSFGQGNSAAQGLPGKFKGKPVSAQEIEALKVRGASNYGSRNVDQQLYVDYSFADNFRQGSGAQSQQSFLWNWNNRFTSIDTSINFIGVRVIEVVGYEDVANTTNTFVEVDYDPNWQMKVDSVFALLSHENNSGLDDTLVLEIQRLAATGNNFQANPPASNIWYSDTITSSVSLSSGGNWVGTGAVFFQTWAPEELIIPAGQKAGLTLKYFGPKQDTMGVVASYVSNPNGPASPNDYALSSDAPYSVLRLPPFFTSITPNSGIFYVGDQDPSTPAIDTGYYFAQNWELWTYSQFGIFSGIDENSEVHLGEPYPNPFGDITYLSFKLKENAVVKAEVYDLNGRLVAVELFGNRPAGDNRIGYTADGLESGMYFVRILADGKASATKKLQVVR